MSVFSMFRGKSKSDEKGGTLGSKARQFIEHLIRVPLQKLNSRSAYLSVGSKKVWASFRACHITASILLSTEFKVVGQTTKAEVINDELQRLLTAPNPHDTWEEIVYQWVFHMKLTGVAFWYKDQMDYKGRPKYVYPLLPQYITVVPHPTNKISHYLYRVNGKEVRYERDEIIYFRRPHPTSFIEGLGDIEPSESLYEEHIMRGDLEKKFLGNGAMPSGVLTNEAGIDDDIEWEKIKKWWRGNYEGKRNAGKTAILGGKWTYTKLGMTHSEMQSIESEKWSIEQIFTNHGVPHSVAGLDKAANLATARQDEINFRKYEIVPLLKLLVGKLNGYGLAEDVPTFTRAFNPNWVIAYELSGLVDVEQKVKEYRPLVQEGGMTLNELREICGLEQDDGNPLLDQYFINSQRLPLEMAGLSGIDIDAIPPDDGAKPKPTVEELIASIAELDGALAQRITAVVTPEG